MISDHKKDLIMKISLCLPYDVTFQDEFLVAAVTEALLCDWNILTWPNLCEIDIDTTCYVHMSGLASRRVAP